MQFPVYCMAVFVVQPCHAESAYWRWWATRQIESVHYETV